MFFIAKPFIDETIGKSFKNLYNYVTVLVLTGYKFCLQHIYKKKLYNFLFTIFQDINFIGCK